MDTTNGNQPRKAYAYHTTTLAAADAIMANGFEDRVSAWGFQLDPEDGWAFKPTGWCPPGVWVALKPPILCIGGFDQLGNDRLAWIEIEIDPTDPVKDATTWEQESWLLKPQIFTYHRAHGMIRWSMPWKATGPGDITILRAPGRAGNTKRSGSSQKAILLRDRTDRFRRKRSPQTIQHAIEVHHKARSRAPVLCQTSRRGS